ncbi:MAG: putative DNA-binding domain-containing protein [Myxococcales bacterium]|nr:putative DNA-binding domain-containing protein [Myxococcales bacterium]MCB9715139.1 putative DNA-binding domain-containing protein [Myxococcales bacterium]
MELRELQQLFLDAIRYPTGIDDFLAQAEPSVRAAFDAAFVGTAALDRRQRMTIYAESYYWRLAEVLGDQYRVVAWLAGPRRFHNLVTDFVWQRPSHSPDVRRFGRELPELIAEHPIAAELEGIEQLARVERSIVEAIDAEDLPRLEEAALAALPLPSWPAMRLQAAPWVRLWSTKRSYPELFEARRLERPSPDPVPPVDGREHHVLVWRHALEVYHRSVPPAEARALRAMLDGASFERICSAAAELAQGDPAGPEQVVGWLRGWLRAGLVTALR